MDYFENDYAVKIKDFSKMFNLSDSTPYELIKRYPQQFFTKKVGKTTYIPSAAVNFYLNLKKKSPSRTQVITSYMRKGGVGKTTLLINLAARSCMHGKKVCIIDLDSQANCTKAFKISNPKQRNTFLNVFHGDVSISDAIIKVRKNLHLLPANNKLTQLTKDIDSMLGFQQFKPFIDKIKDEYDLIFFDCGGLMDITVFQTLAISDKIFSPAFPDDFSDEGLELTTEEIQKIEAQGFKPKHYIVLNTVDPSGREKATKTYTALFESLYDNIAQTRIRKSQEIVNALTEGKSIFEHAYDSKIALEIENLYQEIILDSKPVLGNIAKEKTIQRKSNKMTYRDINNLAPESLIVAKKKSSIITDEILGQNNE